MSEASVDVTKTLLPLTGKNGQGLIRSAEPEIGMVRSIFENGWNASFKGILLPVMESKMLAEYAKCKTIDLKRKYFSEQHAKYLIEGMNFFDTMTFFVADGANRRQAMLDCIPKWATAEKEMPSLFHAQILDPLTPLDVMFRFAFAQNTMAATNTFTNFCDKMTGVKNTNYNFGTTVKKPNHEQAELNMCSLERLGQYRWYCKLADEQNLWDLMYEDNARGRKTDVALEEQSNVQTKSSFVLTEALFKLLKDTKQPFVKLQKFAHQIFEFIFKNYTDTVLSNDEISVGGPLRNQTVSS